MSEFVPVDEVNPTLADIARGVNQVHTCVDGFRFDQGLVNAEAAKVRKETAGKIEDLTEAVGTLDTRQDVSDGKITKLAQLFGAEKVEKGEKKPKGKGLATWGVWQVLTAMSGAFTILVVCFQLFVKIAPVVFDYLMSLSP